ncbi:hypothetical protein GSI_09641 [Ganoderma sinense ZZ0214-1]|uniref:GST N-terminal domain-containing protein n=1 Tax=Ganoderma sinense ZZ0214-1 TaxID=1077348 RepID=A0A2G8S380_9APHY|nr:hypothetical protein GSI_09641 [Ganoderma sinense ZZ0214-1]
MSEKRITLYSAEESPFPQRVALTLEEGNIPYDTISFELLDKPDWYKEKVYPIAQVPYLVYGGPKLQPGDAPSPSLPQLGESLVILEFLADAFPSARLLPSDPFLRAKARLFCRAVEEKYNPAFMGVFFKQAPKEDLYAAVEHIQGLLPPDSGFAVGGEWSIADAAFLPGYLRTLVILELDPALSRFAPGAAAEALAELREAPRFARMQRYLEESMARPSAKKTWDPVRSVLFGFGRGVLPRARREFTGDMMLTEVNLQVSVKAKIARRFDFFLAQAQQREQQQQQD